MERDHYGKFQIQSSPPVIHGAVPGWDFLQKAPIKIFLTSHFSRGSCRCLIQAGIPGVWGFRWLWGGSLIRVPVVPQPAGQQRWPMSCSSWATRRLQGQRAPGCSGISSGAWPDPSRTWRLGQEVSGWAWLCARGHRGGCDRPPPATPGVLGSSSWIKSSGEPLSRSGTLSRGVWPPGSLSGQEGWV